MDIERRVAKLEKEMAELRQTTQPEKPYPPLGTSDHETSVGEIGVSTNSNQRAL